MLESKKLTTSRSFSSSSEKRKKQRRGKACCASFGSTVGQLSHGDPETMPAGGCLFVIVGTDDKPIYQAEFPEARSQRVRRRRSGGSATQSC